MSWDAPDTLPGFDGSPTPPSDGTSWVVVTLSVARPADSPGYCDASVGGVLVDGVYEVPSHKLPDVRGVSYEPFKQRQPALPLFPER